MFQHEIKGVVWKFGHNISTDLLMPGIILNKNITPEEMGVYCLQTLRPDWSSKVKKGDILIAGNNFGCGSSRPAVIALQGLGISLVICQSTTQLFYRNCINCSFPVTTCPEILEHFKEGETAFADIKTGVIKNISTNCKVKGSSILEGSPPWLILENGGLDNIIKNKKWDIFKRV